MTIKIFMEEANITSLGPDLRYGIWFYGCDKKCAGCIYHKKETSVYQTIEVDSLVERICSHKDIEGVTISGGEPFLQYDGLLDLLKKLSQHHLGIIVYTGKQYDELKSDNRYKEALNYIDLLIDGEYIQERDSKNSLIGSANQIPHFLTDRYVQNQSLYGIAGRRKTEVHFANGEVHSVGLPTKEAEIIVETIFGKRRKGNGK